VDLEKFLTQPHWRVEATAEGLGLEPMAEWLRPPGSDFSGMKLAGVLNGQLARTSETAAVGSLSLTGLDWKWGEENRLEAAQLDAVWGDGVIRLAPAALELDGQTLQAECDWTTQRGAGGHGAAAVEGTIGVAERRTRRPGVGCTGENRGG
jgi:hypothetical protein